MKKKPIAQHMPKTWSLALLFLHENRNSGNPRTREQIRAASGCGSDVLTALHRMGALRYFEHKGRMYPTLNESVTLPTPVAIREKIREMNERRNKAKPEPVGSTAENWKRSLQERGQWQSEPEAQNNHGQHEAVVPPSFLKPGGITGGVALATPTLSAAIKVITAAGGMVVFGDKKQ